jgi:arylsulfatase A-like enzyme
LTGRAAHNTNVTDIEPPYGGYPKFASQDLNDKYLPVWLQEGGYATYYTGKLMNYHNILNYFRPFPAGWTSNDFLLDPFTYDYNHPIWQRDQAPPYRKPGNYSTDMMTKVVVDYIDDATKSEKPFFIGAAPVACHADVKINLTEIDLTTIDPNDLLSAETVKDRFRVVSSNPVPAERHRHLFADVEVPRTLNFNPDSPSGVSWIYKLPQVNDTVVAYNDEFYRDRLRALQAVDDMIESVFRKLEDKGILENTYVIYSADNGFHVGQHRMNPGKRCGFEEDINVPLIIRGPGVPKNLTTDIVTTHTDLAPTILQILGIPLQPDFDGTPIPITETGIMKAVEDRSEAVNIEHWGSASNETPYSEDSPEGALCPLQTHF